MTFLKYFLQKPNPYGHQVTYSIRPRYSTFKHFRVSSASDEIVSAYANKKIQNYLMLVYL
jgi:hypothetical protein